MEIELVAAAFLGVASGAWLAVAAAIATNTARRLLREWSPRALVIQAELFAPDLFASHRVTEPATDQRRERAFAPAHNAVA
jgi:hypothetical protein